MALSEEIARLKASDFNMYYYARHRAIGAISVVVKDGTAVKMSFRRLPRAVFNKDLQKWLDGYFECKQSKFPFPYSLRARPPQADESRSGVSKVSRPLDIARGMLRSNNKYGTPFQLTVWRAISAIKFGQVKSYGQIAKAIGRPKAVRAVGNACGANSLPLVIPCHRVVASSGLGGFSGGLGVKKKLLKIEGVGRYGTSATPHITRLWENVGRGSDLT